jgi:hypothetical protein
MQHAPSMFVSINSFPDGDRDVYATPHANAQAQVVVVVSGFPKLTGRQGLAAFSPKTKLLISYQYI